MQAPTQKQLHADVKKAMQAHKAKGGLKTTPKGQGVKRKLDFAEAQTPKNSVEKLMCYCGDEAKECESKEGRPFLS